jgi:pyrroloquinoline quinone biosynthesis protein B
VFHKLFAVVVVSAVVVLPQAQSGTWELVVLGRAQDAGIPQLGCTQAACVDRRAGRLPQERVSSVGLRHTGTGRAYLFDATPDFPSQVHSLTGGRAPDGIFLTHGHIGHYTGLMYLGRESTSASKVPVYGTARMAAFLKGNGPWSQLVSLGNIALDEVVPDRTVDLGDGVRVTPFLVPHRDEFTDTVGYLIAGPNKKALYIPDIDQWSKWDRDIRALADTVDYALLDGTFASAGEIPGRSTADIPHPMMSDTRARLKGSRAQLWFIHLNHTNPELDVPDVVKDGRRFGM